MAEILQVKLYYMDEHHDASFWCFGEGGGEGCLTRCSSDCVVNHSQYVQTLVLHTQASVFIVCPPIYAGLSFNLRLVRMWSF